MKKLKKIYKELISQRWEIGFVTNNIKGIVANEPLKVNWIKNLKGHWFADPFILEVTDTTIIVLVEDMSSKTLKGVISKLTISRKTMTIIKREVILNLPTHLSFPAILRKNDKIYVYPENAYGETLNIYELNETQNKLIFKKTLIDEVIWDSVITDYFGECLLFTARQDDYHLDIYKLNVTNEKFEYWKSVSSDHRNMRMAGQLFKIGDNIYCPSQNCDRNYGNAIEIKEVTFKNETFSFKTIRTLKSTHPTLKEGMHTINEHKGVIVVDVLGYNYPIIANLIIMVRKILKKLI